MRCPRCDIEYVYEDGLYCPDCKEKKAGDILRYSQTWFDVSGASESKRAVRFIATGRVTKQMPNDYLISVVKENGSYVQTYHQSFLESIIE